MPYGTGEAPGSIGDASHARQQRYAIDPLVIGLVSLWAVGFGLASARAAWIRRRSIFIWSALGAVLGPAALILIRVAPPGRCPVCWSRVRGWGYVCTWCGSDVRQQPMPRFDAGPGMAPAADATRPSTTPMALAGPSVPTIITSRDAASAPQTLPTRRNASTATSATTSTHVEGGSEVLGSAVYMTGNVGLRPGGRYSLEFERDLFRVRGPIGVDARAIAVTRPIGSLKASTISGRLIVNGAGEMVILFMRINGSTADHLAETINAAARAAVKTGP